MKPKRIANASLVKKVQCYLMLKILSIEAELDCVYNLMVMIMFQLPTEQVNSLEKHQKQVCYL